MVGLRAAVRKLWESVEGIAIRLELNSAGHVAMQAVEFGIQDQVPRPSVKN